MKRLFKIPLRLILLLVVLLVAFALLTQTPLFRAWLKDQLVKQVNQRLNGELTIEKLDGNLYRDIILTGVQLSRDGQPVVELERLSLRHNPLALLSADIHIDRLLLERPHVHLTREPDGLWNLTQLFADNSANPPANDRPGTTTSAWTLHAPDVQIVEGALYVTGLQTNAVTLPASVRNLNLRLSAAIMPEEVHLTLHRLTLRTTEPAFVFETVQSQFTLGEGHISIEGFNLTTPASKLRSDLHVRPIEAPNLDLSLEGTPLALEDVRQLVPGLRLYGNPQIFITARGPLSELQVDVKVRVGQGRIGVRGTLGLAAEPYTYRLQGDLSALNLATIFNDSSLATNLNLRFEVDGRDVAWETLAARFKVVARNSSALGYAVDRTEISGRIRDTALSFSGNLTTQGMYASLHGDLTARPQQVPRYTLTGGVRALDLARVIDTLLVPSDLNFDFRAQGVGFDVLTGYTNLSLDFRPSRLGGVPIDSARMDLSLRDDVVDVRDFLVASPKYIVTAEGNLGLTRKGQLKLLAEIDDFAAFSSVSPVDSLWGRGKLTGQLEGAVDSLSVQAVMQLAEGGFRDLTIRDFEGRCEGLVADGRTSFDLSGGSDRIAAYGLDSLGTHFNLSYRDTVLNYDITVQQPQNGLIVASEGDLIFEPDSYVLALRKLKFEGFNQAWQQVGPPAAIRFSETRLEVSDLALASGAQRISVHGMLEPAGRGDLYVEMDSLDVARLIRLYNPQADYEGRLRLTTHLTGTPERPIIDGAFIVREGEYFQIPFQELRGQFGYEDRRVTWKFGLTKTSQDSITETSGHLPFDLSLSPFRAELLQAEEMEFKLSTRGIDLSFVQGFFKNIRNVEGLFVADIVLSNTLKDLRGVGPIRLVDGRFDVPDLGTRYRNIDLVLLLRGQEVEVRDFRVKSGGGDLRIIDGSLSLSQQAIENFTARLRANNFEVMNNKKMRGTVSGQMQATGTVTALEITGELTVPSARVYYPAWMEEETVVELTEKPFFVIAEDTSEFDPRGAIRFQKSGAQTEVPFYETRFYKNLRATLALHFPRNTWLRSEEANVEVEGELQLVKEGQHFVIFGQLTAVRGHYELQGNRFQILEGRITFKGDPEINPDIHVEALHKFRQESEGEFTEHEVKVVITGNKEEPQFEFTLDGAPADQKDILSILLFGRTFDKLPIGQRSDVAASETGLEEQATGIITGQLLKRLSGALSRELNLDVLQIERGESLGDTKVRVGKYVTPDVFVSVSQDFGAEGTQEVQLEYEIPKKILFFNLFLQASKERRGNTALDLIWKIEW